MLNIFTCAPLPCGSDFKESDCNSGDMGLIPGSRRSPGEGNGNPLQYSCLENPMDRGTWWATIHGVTKSRDDLANNTHTHTYTHTHTHTHTFDVHISSLVKCLSCPLWREIFVFYYCIVRITCMCAQSLSCIWLFETPQTVACQTPHSMEFSKQEYWSGLPFPTPGNQTQVSCSPELAGKFFITVPPWTLQIFCKIFFGKHFL